MSEKTKEDVMSKSAPKNDDKAGPKIASHCPQQLTNYPTSISPSETCNSVSNIRMSSSDNLVTVNEDQRSNNTEDSNQQITADKNG